jgi:hypothetical protein
VKTATNKRLLIFESHDDSNQYTPCREKPDHHTTRFPGSVRVCSSTIRISRDPHIATFHEVINRFEQIHCSWKEGLPTQPLARLSDLRVCSQPLSQKNHWSSGENPSFCWQLASRLIAPISPTCDRYVQYLFAGTNPSVLNRHRWGLQPWRCQLATHHSPTFPISDLPFCNTPSP